MRSLSRPSLRQRTSRSSPSPLWAYRGSFQASGRIRAVRSARIVLLLTSSRPEEFHLRALPEPCMTLSSHTAPDVRPLLERLCLVHRLLLFPVGQWPRPNNAAPSLQPHYRAFDATTGCSAPAPRFGTLALAVGAACGLSLHVIGVTKHRFSRSIRKPGRASRRLHAGCRSGSIRASPELIPEEGSPPGSDIA